MIKDLNEHLSSMNEIISELEAELEQEISQLIKLKSRLNPKFVNDLEKIEEGLYVEVKMINETKKYVELMKEILQEKAMKETKGIKDTKDTDPATSKGDDTAKLKARLQKLEKREKGLVKQLIKANEEIEKFKDTFAKKLKERENELKDEMIKKFQEKDEILNEKLFESQHKIEELMHKLSGYKNGSKGDTDELEQLKKFFTKKIENVKNTMSSEFKSREKEITKKAIIAYNKKKEKIYTTMIKEVLTAGELTTEADSILKSLRDVLELADDVYEPSNFALCGVCGEVIHSTQKKCPKCKTKFD